MEKEKEIVEKNEETNPIGDHLMKMKMDILELHKDAMEEQKIDNDQDKQNEK